MSRTTTGPSWSAAASSGPGTRSSSCEAGFSVDHLEADAGAHRRIGAQLRAGLGERPALGRRARCGPAGPPSLGGGRRRGARHRVPRRGLADRRQRRRRARGHGGLRAPPRRRGARGISFLEPDEVRACNPAVRGDIEGALHCAATPWSSPAAPSARCAPTSTRGGPGPLPLPPGSPRRRDRAARRSSTRRAPAGRGTSSSSPPAPPTTTCPAPTALAGTAAAGPPADARDGAVRRRGSRRRWPTPTRCATTRPTRWRRSPLLGQQDAVAADHHLQLLLVQRPDGGLTIGDTHAYEEPFDFALCEDPTEELLARARRILGSGAPAGAAPLGGCLRPVHRRRGVPARGDPAGGLGASPGPAGAA